MQTQVYDFGHFNDFRRVNAIARSKKLIQPYNAIKELQYIAVASPQLSILLRSYYTHFTLN